MIHALPLPAQLLRGFAIDFLTAHDPAVAKRIMDPAYRLTISGQCFDGRDAAYLPATIAQLALFPGLCVTVHDVVLSPGAVAMRFTEHGTSEGRTSSWGGITLFSVVDGRLREGWAEEDYLARKRQLKSGVVDAIRAPHPAPWDAPVGDADPATEAVVRRWLATPSALFDTAEEISAQGPRLAELIVPAALEISTLFAAGSRAAFHGVLAGRYTGAFADVDEARRGCAVTLAVAGIVDTDEGRVRRAQLCGDRLGLSRRLRGPI